MSKFRHTPDDMIFINNTVFPLSFFITLVPTYILPVGAIERYYDDSLVHYTTNGINTTGQSFPYTDGDIYIANEAAYAAAYATYLNPTPSLPDAKVSKINDLITYSNNIRSSYIIHLGRQYFSSDGFCSKLMAYDATYTRSSLPGGFYVNDIAYNQKVMANIAELEVIIDQINGLSHLCDLNEDVHRVAINALGTVGAVTAYDYTTGWPITPYSPNATFYAKYDSTINATYSGGVGTGTAVGGAAIASGWLDLAHNDVRYVNYAALANADSQQTGYGTTIIKPNYSGAPATDQVYVTTSKANSDPINLIEIRHLNATSNIKLTIKDQAGANIISSSLGAWTPVSGTSYKFSLYYDITTGNTFLAIDDVQLGATSAATGTRSASIGLLRVGVSYDSAEALTSNFSIKELQITSA